MIKRPLGIFCLFIIALIFLLIEFLQLRDTKSYSFSKEEVSILGTVCKKDIAKSGSGEVLYLKDVLFVGEAESAHEDLQQVICYLKEDSLSAKIGSRILIRGYPSDFESATNPGQFDQKFYYQILGISFRLSQANVLSASTEYDVFYENLHILRCKMAAQLDLLLPKEDAGIMKAVLLGAKGDIDEELKALYQRGGIAHILAISGLHISLLGMGAFELLRRLGVPLKAAAFLAAVFMFCYGIMTGFSVSMLRAVIMFLLHMLARMIGRTYDMLTAAGVAAVLILMEQPLYLYYGGFVFSFGCVIGIGLALPVLTESKNRLPFGLKNILSACAMGVISYPMYLWFYYQFPVYSVWLNLMVIPLMSFLMAAGLVLFVVSCFVPGAVVFPASLIHGILMIYEKACSICEELPGHMFTPGKPDLWQVIIYLVLLLAVIGLSRLKKKKITLLHKWIIMVAGIILISIRPWDLLEVTFLDVGQGDCIFIKSPAGKNYLIDGGSTSVSSVGKYRILPFLKYKGADEIEAVIITHPDEDHVSGVLELLETGDAEGIRVKNIVLPEISQELKNTAYKEVEWIAQKEGVRVSYINTGESIKDHDITMQCLNPDKHNIYREANEYSVVLLVQYGTFQVLLTGDAEGMGELELTENLKKLKTGGDITVLKAAHHGSKYSTSEELLDIISPRLTVISCGNNNRYGHPHEETLERLSAIGSRIWMTPDCGAVTVEVRDHVKVYGFVR